VGTFAHRKHLPHPLWPVRNEKVRLCQHHEERERNNKRKSRERVEGGMTREGNRIEKISYSPKDVNASRQNSTCIEEKNSGGEPERKKKKPGESVIKLREKRFFLIRFFPVEAS